MFADVFSLFGFSGCKEGNCRYKSHRKIDNLFVSGTAYVEESIMSRRECGGSEA
jgi:hypothetical protein